MRWTALFLKALVVSLGLFALATTPSRADASDQALDNVMVVQVEGSSCSFCQVDVYCPSPAQVNTWCQVYGWAYGCFTGGTCTEGSSECNPWARFDCY